MVHISFTNTVSQNSNIVVIKYGDTALSGVYADIHPLLDSIHFDESAVFANMCGAKCVYVVEKSDDTTAQQVGSTLSQVAKKSETVFVDTRGFDADDIVDMAVGARLKSYVFDTHKTITKKPNALKNIAFVCDDIQVVEKSYLRASAVVDGICVARDVTNEPANILTPVAYAERTEQLRDLGVKVTILEPAELSELGMGALLGVAQGSVNPARVVVMEWNGGKDMDAPFAFVGKGVTFDTGGISLKPAQGMEDMKIDMGGSAAVYGAIHSIATRKAKANVVGVIGLVENMPDGNAQRPGDIVTSMSGQTIEILNTDAEGRLVLADCLTFVQQKYNPKSIVNLATLTGAILVALGTDYAGLFSNNDDFAAHLLGVSKNAGERLWHMPVCDVFDKQMDSPVADMKNISSGRWGGASTAAAFLSRFVNKDTPWAHLDIAGTASTNKGNTYSPTGGTGFGVATLDRLVYEFETKNG